MDVAYLLQRAGEEGTGAWRLDETESEWEREGARERERGEDDVRFGR